jgi:hypothetical protein
MAKINWEKNNVNRRIENDAKNEKFNELVTNVTNYTEHRYRKRGSVLNLPPHLRTKVKKNPHSDELYTPEILTLIRRCL